MAIIPYDRITNLQNDQALAPTDPYPAQKLDQEYNAIKITTDDLIQHLGLIQRDDGQLENGSVGRDQLNEDVLIGFGAPEQWLTSHDYVVGDTVFQDNAFWYCEVSHTSTTFTADFTAGYWSLIADFADAVTEGARMYVGDSPPVAATNGQQWFESNTGATYIWFDDGNSGQWVQTNGDAGGGSGGSGGGAPPSNVPPQMNGAADPGVLTNYSRGDHRHPSDTSRYSTAGGVLTGDVLISKPAPLLTLNAQAAPDTARIRLTRAGLDRWLWAMDGVGETGADGGSNLGLWSYNDAGALLSNPLYVDRKTGALTLQGDLKVAHTNPVLFLNKPLAGQASYILGQLNGVSRWHMSLGDATAESGANAGSDFQIVRYPDAAGAGVEVLRIARSTGLMTLAADPVVALGTATKQYVDGRSRDKLTADRTYFVKPAASGGNDAADGTTLATAWATLQKAYDFVSQNLDLNAKRVTVSVADNVTGYAAGLNITVPWVGGGTLDFVGNITTPANCLISPTGANCVHVGCGLLGTLVMRGFRLKTISSGGGFSVAAPGVLLVVDRIDFNAIVSVAVLINSPGSMIQFGGNGSCSITAASQIFWQAQNGGQIQCRGQTFTITGTPAWGYCFATADIGGIIHADFNTFTGAATGTRYIAASNAIINTGGGGPNYFPGSVAGTGTNSGAGPNYGLYL